MKIRLSPFLAKVLSAFKPTPSKGGGYVERKANSYWGMKHNVSRGGVKYTKLVVADRSKLLR